MFVPDNEHNLVHKSNFCIQTKIGVFISSFLSCILSFSFLGVCICAVGWGSIHLGFSNNTDPEPGRCRRTDGKKWRCWRDAVPDQKYCERHMNRGRHRSRKPVEPVAGTTAAATTTTTTSKQLMSSASSSASSVSIPAGGGSSSLSIANQQLKSLQPAASNSSAATQMNR